jgi:hypothetical protein
MTSKEYRSQTGKERYAYEIQSDAWMPLLTLWNRWLILARLWEYLDLDSHSVLMMLKGALAPTITIAMYEYSGLRISQLLRQYIQIPEYCDFKYNYNYRLPLGPYFRPFTGPHATSKVHEDHVLRPVIYMRLGIYLLSRCILRRQGTSA